MSGVLLVLLPVALATVLAGGLLSKSAANVFRIRKKSKVGVVPAEGSMDKVAGGLQNNTAVSVNRVRKTRKVGVLPAEGSMDKVAGGLQNNTAVDINRVRKTHKVPAEYSMDKVAGGMKIYPTISVNRTRKRRKVGLVPAECSMDKDERIDDLPNREPKPVKADLSGGGRV